MNRERLLNPSNRAVAHFNDSCILSHFQKLEVPVRCAERPLGLPRFDMGAHPRYARTLNPSGQ